MITNINEFKEFNEKKLITDTAKPKPGKMHKALGIPDNKEIQDVYTSGKKLATDLVKAVGKKKATGMIAFVANINPEVNIYDKALKALDKIDESVSEGENILPDGEDLYHDIDWSNVENKFNEFASVYSKEDYPKMRQTFNFIKSEIEKYKMLN